MLPAADDAAAPGIIATLKGHTESVYSLAFTADGKHLVTGSGDRTLRIWDSATGKEIKQLGGPSGHQALVLSVALNREGTLIASGGSDNSAKLWDFPTSTPVRTFAKSEGEAVLAVRADGMKLAGGDKEGRVKIWNAVDGKELLTLEGHRGAVNGVAVSSNGAHCASGPCRRRRSAS